MPAAKSPLVSIRQCGSNAGSSPCIATSTSVFPFSRLKRLPFTCHIAGRKRERSEESEWPEQWGFSAFSQVRESWEPRQARDHEASDRSGDPRQGLAALRRWQRALLPVHSSRATHSAAANVAFPLGVQFRLVKATPTTIAPTALTRILKRVAFGVKTLQFSQLPQLIECFDRDRTDPPPSGAVGCRPDVALCSAPPPSPRRKSDADADPDVAELRSFLAARRAAGALHRRLLAAHFSQPICTLPSSSQSATSGGDSEYKIHLAGSSSTTTACRWATLHADLAAHCRCGLCSLQRASELSFPLIPTLGLIDCNNRRDVINSVLYALLH